MCVYTESARKREGEREERGREKNRARAREREKGGREYSAKERDLPTLPAIPRFQGGGVVPWRGRYSAPSTPHFFFEMCSLTHLPAPSLNLPARPTTLSRAPSHPHPTCSELFTPVSRMEISPN